MPHDINAALERLEQNLQDIDSARRQVEKTVNTSDELRKTVNGYVASVNQLYDDIKEWEKRLQQSQMGLSSEVQETFDTLKTSCDRISDSFKSSTEKTLDKFKPTVYNKDVRKRDERKEKTKCSHSNQTEKSSKFSEHLKRQRKNSSI